MIDIYLINAFQDRTEAARREIAKLADGPVHIVRAPIGDQAVGWMGCRTWRDPARDNRLLTWGEVACFAGHHEAWTRIAAEGKPALIVEDDLAVMKALPMEKLTGDICYFGGQPLAPFEDTGEPTVLAPYTWCLHGYYITSTAAQKLADATVHNQVIPADEFVPYHCGTNPNVDQEKHQQKPAAGLEARMLREFVVEQTLYGAEGTTSTAAPAFELHTVIFATDPDRVNVDAWKSLGYEPHIIGAGEPEWDTSRAGGMPKLYWLRDHLQRRARPREIVLALDGYDTQPLISADDLVARWAGMEHCVVVGGELDCWPDESLSDHEMFKQKDDDGLYRFPNSGTMMGWAQDFLDDLTDENLDPYDDDQLAVTWRCIRKPCCWKVDASAYCSRR